ncbi:MAG: thioredoxin family protein [Flavobacteriales bacterium]|jgi:thiol-disulfide isomerase/thioredoxin|nr:thioredoxin family protein [Flavobacteriales bacterium]
MYTKNIIFFICFSIIGINLAQENSDWLIEYEEVYQKSIQEGKPIMANFTGSDWCGWCKKLKKAVFDTKLFKDWAEKNVILFELDYPRRTPQNPEIQKQNRELQQTFRQFVRGYPTVILFEIERTYKDDGSKDKDNIQLLPSTQLVLQGQGRMGYMSSPESFIEKAELIIDVKKD